MVPHGKAHTQPFTVDEAAYLELPVGGEVRAPVEAGVELHPVPGHAPCPAPWPQLRVTEQGPALRGHVVTPRLQPAACKQEFRVRATLMQRRKKISKVDSNGWNQSRCKFSQIII